MRMHSVAAGIAGLLALASCMNTREPEELKPLDKNARELAKQNYSFTTTARDGGVTARLWVPPGENALAGTWQARVTFPDSSVLQVQGERDGTIANVWLRDLGSDGALDFVVTTTSAGIDSYGSVGVYSLAAGRIVKRELTPFDVADAPGYRGHDTIGLLNGELRRSYPIYKAGDADAGPSGGIAQYRYDFARNRWVEGE